MDVTCQAHPHARFYVTERRDVIASYFGECGKSPLDFGYAPFPHVQAHWITLWESMPGKGLTFWGSLGTEDSGSGKQQKRTFLGATIVHRESGEVPMFLLMLAL